MQESDFTASENWALAQLDGAHSPAPQFPHAWLDGLRLSSDERDVVLLLYVRERSAQLRERLLARTGISGGRVSRFFLEQWLGREVLSTKSGLWRHALVVSQPYEGEAFPFLFRLVEIARDRLDERSPESWLWPQGSEFIAVSESEATLPSAAVPVHLSQISKEILVTEQAMWSSVDGLTKSDEHTLAHDFAKRSGRALVLLDLDDLALRGGERAAWLRALRLEADRADWTLLVAGRGRHAGTARFLVADSFASRSVRVIFSGPVLPAGIGSGKPVQIGPPNAPSSTRPIDDSHKTDIDDAKRKAAQDAERALTLFGRPSQAVMPSMNSNTRAVAPAPAPREERVGRPAPRPIRPQPAGAEIDSHEAEQFFPRAAPAPERDAEPPVRAERPAIRRPAPPVVSADDSLDADVLAATAMTSADPEERIASIGKLAGQRSPRVIAALRANVQSGHEGVRKAAETAMAALFGPDWNRTRAIAKPVQPPRSDDDSGIPGL